jgi:hypothetical protein
MSQMAGHVGKYSLTAKALSLPSDKIPAVLGGGAATSGEAAPGRHREWGGGWRRRWGAAASQGGPSELLGLPGGSQTSVSEGKLEVSRIPAHIRPSDPT